MLRFFLVLLCACGDDGSAAIADGGALDGGGTDSGGPVDAGPPGDAGGECPCDGDLACVRGVCIDACGVPPLVLEDSLSAELVPLAHHCVEIGEAAFGATNGFHTARVVERSAAGATVRLTTMLATGGEPPFVTSDHDFVVAAPEDAAVSVVHPLGLDVRDGYPLVGVRVRRGDVDLEGLASINTWSTFPVTGFSGALSMGHVRSVSTDWHDWIVSARGESGEAVLLRWGIALEPFVVNLGAHPGSVCAVPAGASGQALVTTAGEEDGSVTLFAFAGELDPAAPLDARSDPRVLRVPDFEKSEIVCSSLGILTQLHGGWYARELRTTESGLAIGEPRLIASTYFLRIAPVHSYGGLSAALALDHTAGVLIAGTR